jgi:hypothetical protein
MKSAEQEIIELALKDATPAHKKVGWVSVFNKVLVPVQRVFSFKAKAFSFCLFYCTRHRHSERSEESSYILPWILRFRATHFTQDDGVKTPAFYILATSKS